MSIGHVAGKLAARASRKRVDLAISPIVELLENRTLLSDATGAISGNVFNDLNGDSVRNVGESGISSITIYNDADASGTPGEGEASTVTDANGHYVLTGLVAGDYNVQEVVPVGWHQTAPLNNQGWTLALQAGQTVGDKNFGQHTDAPPPSTGSIGGNVFNDLNGNGVQNDGETGLPGITVYNDANNDGKLETNEFHTTTDANGNYVLSNLPAGAYKIREVLPPHWKQTTPASNFGWTLTLAAGQAFTGAAFGEQAESTSPATGVIAGVVFNDLNGNGVRNDGEAGITGITVYNDANNDGALNQGELSTVAGANGVYILNNLPAGSYKICEVVPPHWKQTAPANQMGWSINLAAGQGFTAANFGEQAEATTPQTGAIGGVVFNDLNGNGVRDDGETGIPGITVYSDASNDGKLSGGELSTITDASGLYVLNNLPVGSYKIREVVPPHWKQTTPANNFGWSVVLTPGQGFTAAIFGEQAEQTPPTTGVIAGVVFNDLNGNGVRNNGENGISGITIYNDANNDGKLSDGELNTVTDANGVFILSNLPGGSYKIREVLPPHWKQTTPANNFGWSINLIAGQGFTGAIFGEQTESTTPPPTGTIGGNVFNDLNGNSAKNDGEMGLAGITVYSDANNNGKLDSNESSTVTDASGNYVFSNLTAGTYKIREVLPPHWKQTTPTNNFGWTVPLASGQAFTGANFGEQAETPPPSKSYIAGSVFNDTNGNLKRDDGEPGLSVWTVYIDANNDGILELGETSVQTGTSGEYAFTNLVLGEYVIRVVPQDGWVQTTPANNFGQHITLAASQGKTGVVFGEHVIVGTT